MASIVDYPPVVVQEIAKRLDYATIKSMKLTNRHVYNVLSDPGIWIDLCSRDNCLPSEEFKKSLAKEATKDTNVHVGQLSLERIWALRRMVTPPILHSQKQMRKQYGWIFSPGFTPKLSVEEPPIGVVPHPEITRCFASSCGSRTARINLVDKGVPEWVLDHLRPRIVVSEMVAPLRGHAAEYTMSAQLLREDDKAELAPFGRVVIRCSFARRERDMRVIPSEHASRSWKQSTDPAVWERVEVSFENYPKGMRDVAVRSDGRAEERDADGYCGAKFTNLEVRIELPKKFRWLTKENFCKKEDKEWAQKEDEQEEEKDSDSPSTSAPRAKKARRQK